MKLNSLGMLLPVVATLFASFPLTSCSSQHERFVLRELHTHLSTAVRLANVVFLESGLRDGSISPLELSRQVLRLNLDEQKFDRMEDDDSTTQLLESIEESEVIDDKDWTALLKGMDAVGKFDKDVRDTIVGLINEDYEKALVTIFDAQKEILSHRARFYGNYPHRSTIAKLEWFKKIRENAQAPDLQSVANEFELSELPEIATGDDVRDSFAFLKFLRNDLKKMKFKKIDTARMNTAIQRLSEVLSGIGATQIATIDKLKVSMKNLERMRDSKADDDVASVLRLVPMEPEALFEPSETRDLLVALPNDGEDIDKCSAGIRSGLVSATMHQEGSIVDSVRPFLTLADELEASLLEIEEMVRALESPKWSLFLREYEKMKSKVKAGDLFADFQTLKTCFKDLKVPQNVKFTAEKAALSSIANYSKRLQETLDWFFEIKGDAEKVVGEDVVTLSDDWESWTNETSSLSSDEVLSQLIGDDATFATMLAHLEALKSAHGRMLEYMRKEKEEMAKNVEDNKKFTPTVFADPLDAMADMLRATGIGEKIECFGGVSGVIAEMKSRMEEARKVWRRDELKTNLESVVHTKRLFRRAKDDVARAEKAGDSMRAALKQTIKTSKQSLKQLADGVQSLGEFVNVQEAWQLLTSFTSTDEVFETHQETADKEDHMKSWDSLLVAISEFLESISASLMAIRRLDALTLRQRADVVQSIAEAAAEPKFSAIIEPLSTFFATTYSGAFQERIVASLEQLKRFESEFGEHKQRMLEMGQGMEEMDEWVTGVTGPDRARSSAECECSEITHLADPCHDLCYSSAATTDDGALAASSSTDSASQD